ncbi:MAG: SAM-dependent methyltransferase [Candidatus Paceibacter sp.]|jgi:23S rRNA (cytosine1962-C5)-methyltransferase|nr:SAM-dependent methyltransferase [Candidatus Paceibacter sp.]
MDLKTLITDPEAGYTLLDSGDGEKLERYGDFVVSRPDPQALWKKSLSQDEWEKAHAKFSSLGSSASKSASWKIAHEVPTRWDISFSDFKFYIRPTSFKHTGLFPEQKPNWEWIQQRITEVRPRGENRGPTSAIRVLNLFGYTGGATLAAARAGADVVHVDGSKVALQWAKDNAQLSGLKEKPIRWLLDDAFAFVQREIRRGNKYDAIIMDPPNFGHGPKGELWKIEEKFLPLLDSVKELLTPHPLFILINGYAAGYSALAYENALKDLMKEYKGEVSVGELAIREQSSNKLLPSGIFARWSKN